MIVVLFNKEEIIITQEEANRIDDMIEADVKWITIGQFRIRPSAIALIKPGGFSETDKVPQSHRLERPDYRGKPSTVKEELRKRWSKH